jgi:tRNA A-37 threonylcarbamoyl transferase component Bud32
MNSSPSDPFHGLDPAGLMAAAAMPTDGDADTLPLQRADLPSLDEIAAAFPDLEILGLIGHGGMSAVFKARQPKLDRVVALKVLPKSLAATPGFAERFNREGRVLARLSHPSIVAVHDFGESGGFAYLIMEFVDGVNLRQAMRAGRFTPDQALKIIPAICDALQFAHTQGVLHRDIKPENILLDTTGRVKIADFGIAKILDEKGGDMLLTQSGAKLGTAPYMAPEQIEQPASVDHRADIYSLGVVFYEMLTGELPLGRFAAPSTLSSVGGNIDEIVFRALEKERARRQQSVDEFKTQIEGAGGESKPRRSWNPNEPFEYKSKRMLCGLPLLHIVVGRDPVTGRARTANGFFAFGDRARGVFAFGGIARGIFAFGGLAVGVVAFGGGAFGLISFGGLALGLLFALGGMSIGSLAIGGLALGYHACGGVAVGWYAVGGEVLAHQGYGGHVTATHVVRNLQFMPPLTNRLGSLSSYITVLSVIMGLIWLPLSGLTWKVHYWARMQASIAAGEDAPEKKAPSIFWLLPALSAACAVFWWVVYRVYSVPGTSLTQHIIPVLVTTSGVLMFLAALPLWLRLVPMNSLYGLRLSSTMVSDERWYDANAHAGKKLFEWSLAIIVAGMAGFYQLPRHQDDYPWAALALVITAVVVSCISCWSWLRHHPVKGPVTRPSLLARSMGNLVVAVIVAFFIKSFIFAPYRIAGGAETGVTTGSHWIASKIDNGFSTNNLVVYENDRGQAWIGRVDRREPDGLLLRRGPSNVTFFVKWNQVIGKLIFSHFTPDGLTEEPVIEPPTAVTRVSEGSLKAPDSSPALHFSRLTLNLADWRWPVYAPDGRPVENAISQPLIWDASHTDRESSKANDCWWQLWFQHPDFDDRSMLHVSITHLDGSEIAGRDSSFAGPSIEQPNSLACMVISPGRKGSLPKAVRMVLRYSIGPWTNGRQVKPDFDGFMAFKHGELGGMGEGMEKRAFMTWLKKTDDWQPDVVARLLNGQSISWRGASSSTSNQQIIQKFEFQARLAEIDFFQTRTRAIRTVVFDQVVVPPLPDDENARVSVQIGAGRSSPVKWKPGLTVADAIQQAGDSEWRSAKVFRLIRDGHTTNYSFQLAEKTETKPDDQILLPE